MYSYPITFKNQYLDIHENNKKIIHEKLILFLNENNLSLDDVIVLGSSCGIYMDYFVVRGTVKDIDIVIPNGDISNIKRTNMIDILPVDYTLPLNKDTVKCDGINFLSKEDLLVSFCLSVLRKMKRRNVMYIRILLMDIGMMTDDFISLFTTTLNRMSNSDIISTCTERLPILKQYFSDDIINQYKNKFDSIRKKMEVL